MKILSFLAVVFLVGRIEAVTIAEQLTALGCTKLLDALYDTELNSTLEDLPAVTLFAPTNDAMDAVTLPEDPTDLLTYHAAPASYQSTDITNDLRVDSVLTDRQIRFNVNKDSTVYTAQGASIDLTEVDQAVDNGFIHVIDAVMVPPTQTIYQLVSDTDDFSSLKDAIDACGLASVLNGEGPFTVFAPTNAAFEKLGEEKIANLLADTDLLTEVLLAHTVGATAFSAGLINRETYTTESRDTLTVIINGDGVVTVAVDNSHAKVSGADQSVTNGVVHIVDTVLMPIIDLDQDSGVSKTTTVQTGLILSCLAVLYNMF